MAPVFTVDEQLLTTAEAADQLRISPDTLKYWRRMKQGPTYVRVGSRRIRYRPEDLARFLDEQVPDGRS